MASNTGFTVVRLFWLLLQAFTVVRLFWLILHALLFYSGKDIVASNIGLRW